jgi:hypothetical protein
LRTWPARLKRALISEESKRIIRTALAPITVAFCTRRSTAWRRFSAAAIWSRPALVASLARPGGNLTGVSIMVSELMPKRLDLLYESFPR